MAEILRLAVGWAEKEQGVFWFSLWLSPPTGPGRQEAYNTGYFMSK